MTRFILIRHGQSEANLNRICSGQSDYPLSKKGRAQAEATGEFLKNEKIDAIYSSDISRAYDTAKCVARHHGLSVTRDARLREINRGIFEGLPFTEVKQRYPEQYHVLATNKPFVDIEGGESTETVQERVFQCISELAQKHEGQTVAVAFHATALRYFCAKAENVPKEKIQTDIPDIDNCALNYLEYEKGKFTVIKYNSCEHLHNLKTELIEE